MKHTPGPWKVAEEYDGWTVYKPDGEIGRTVIAREIEQGYDGGAADARLIAAAPELLYMLELMVDRYGHIGASKEVLRKAKGK